MFQSQFNGCQPQLPLASLAVDDIGVHGENVLSFFELLHFWRRGLSGDNGPWWLNPLDIIRLLRKRGTKTGSRV
jgi:hypothetical protein